MTEKLTPKEILTSKQNFSEFIEDYNPPVVINTLAEYPQADGKVIVKIAELTQHIETLTNMLGDSVVRNMENPPYITWFITNEKEDVLNSVTTMNKFAVNGYGIFIFKAFLNDDKIDVKCILKPELKPKKERIKTISKTGGIQLDYWNAYFNTCDEMAEGDYQVKPASQHYQNIPIGLKGAYIKQTISVKDNYVASELFIPDNKPLFADLKKHEKEIEKELGAMTWDCKDSNKSCFIRRMIFVNFTNPERYQEYAKQQIEMAIKVRETFFKYI